MMLGTALFLRMFFCTRNVIGVVEVDVWRCACWYVVALVNCAAIDWSSKGVICSLASSVCCLDQNVAIAHSLIFAAANFSRFLCSIFRFLGGLYNGSQPPLPQPTTNNPWQTIHTLVTTAEHRIKINPPSHNKQDVCHQPSTNNTTIAWHPFLLHSFLTVPPYAENLQHIGDSSFHHHLSLSALPGVKLATFLSHCPCSHFPKKQTQNPYCVDNRDKTVYHVVPICQFPRIQGHVMHKLPVNLVCSVVPSLE
jgi:hypothetical protein